MKRGTVVSITGILILVVFILIVLTSATFSTLLKPRIESALTAVPSLAIPSTASPGLPPTAILDPATAISPELTATLSSNSVVSSDLVQFPTPLLDSSTSQKGAEETLAALQNAYTPEADPRALVERFRGIKNIPLTVVAPALPNAIGSEKKFWVTDDNTHQNIQVNTVLREITSHAYFWVEKGLSYRESDLANLADAFESQIYPTDRRFFGSEWTPGVDNDPRIYIIYIRGMGGRLAGYFSSVDELHPLAHPYSNAHEAFFLNADTLPLSQAAKTLAHEFQHMIHWHIDLNEETWMNEGFSMLATFLNHYDTGSFDRIFAVDPDQQLNDWPTDPNERSSYYGSSFLFLAYFLDRFGEDVTKSVVASAENGLDSIDSVLEDLHIVTSTGGQPVLADDVFADWAVTNYVQNPSVGDGRYAYKSYTNPPKMQPTESIDRCPFAWQDRTVHQYGTDYIKISCSSPVTLHFQGVREVGVIGVNPHSGRMAFWSNKGDDSDSSLTRVFDFSKVKGPVEMSYWTWYDLENDYDYVYLEASLDGENWEILKPPSCTENNVSGNSFGCGYNGQSGDWIEQKVDLSRYAGKQVWLRFESITDAAVNGEGFLLDDVQIPAVGYRTDFEGDDGGWQAEGFVRIQNRLPQTYRVELIKEGKNISVENVPINSDGEARVKLNFGDEMKDAVLVVSGTTRYTRQQALYRFSVAP